MALPVDAVTLQLAERLAERARARKQHGANLTVGICGAQGSGKSTLVPVLRDLLEQRGLTAATLSLDDFYLTRRAREELARSVHPLLKTRGVPGTHDVPLALQVFRDLRQPGTVALPLFDKARDDRSPQEEWPETQAPVDVILFEGWCVGAVAESQQSLSQPVNSLERDEDPDGRWRRYVNDELSRAYRPLYDQIDLLILLAAPSFDVVADWRREQELGLRQKIIAQGGDASGTMSDAQIGRFVAHYERLTRHILAEMPARADIVVDLDRQRRKKTRETRDPAPGFG